MPKGAKYYKNDTEIVSNQIIYKKKEFMFFKKNISERNLKLQDWQPFTLHNIIDFEINDIVYLNSNPESPMRINNIDYTNNEIQTIINVNNEMIVNIFKPCCLQLYSDVCFVRFQRSNTVICLN